MREKLMHKIRMQLKQLIELNSIKIGDEKFFLIFRYSKR